jgi:serine/threonine protein kinase
VDPQSASELFPRQFGKYTLLSRLSAGGMAEVFLALYRSALGFEKLVVVKRILPSRSGDRAFLDMFLREARIVARLSHPHIVQTFDAGDLEGTYFIAMEHVHGEDLRAILRAVKKRGADALPREHALHIALGVCSGLAYLHEKRDAFGEELGIVHCDISTRNVVVGFTGDVKIVDFGIATGNVEDPSDFEQRPIQGKARFMSPEQAAGEVLDARADIFSLGVVLFELTTGHRCFPAATDLATLRSIHDSGFARPGEVASGYPPALERIVIRALQKNRADRYPSAREMQADLEEFVRNEGIAVSPIGLTAWMCSLFEEELVSGEKTLRALKERVDALGAPQDGPATASGDGEAMAASRAVGGSFAPHEMSIPLSARWHAGTSMVLAGSALAVAAAFFAMQHDMSARSEALKKNQDAQARRTSSSPAPAEATGSLEIDTKPQGCSVWINGAERREITPTKLDGLPLERELHVKLTKDGFEAHRATVKLTNDAPFKDVEAQLQKLPGTILLQSDWHVSFNLWVDGKLWKDHSTIDGLSPDEEHILGLYTSGYAPRTYRVVLQPGETKTLDVRFWKADIEQSSTPPVRQLHDDDVGRRGASH